VDNGEIKNSFLSSEKENSRNPLQRGGGRRRNNIPLEYFLMFSLVYDRHIGLAV
jgi:hypothetical protein